MSHILDYDFEDDIEDSFDPYRFLDMSEDFDELVDSTLDLEREDEILSDLLEMFDDEFSAIEEKIELNKDALYLVEPEITNLLNLIKIVCEEKYSVDGDYYFELMLAELGLPSYYQFTIMDEDDGN